MAHELESVNGQTAFASLRQPAWHGLGTVFEEEVNTGEMLRLAHLDNWNVRLEDMPIPSHLTSDKEYQYGRITKFLGRHKNYLTRGLS